MRKIKGSYFFTIPKAILMVFCIYSLSACALAKNVINTPFVCASYLLNGESQKDLIRELKKDKNKLNAKNTKLASNLSSLTDENTTLRGQGIAFNELIKRFENNPCFHVDRRGEFEVLVQPRMTQWCME